MNWARSLLDINLASDMAVAVGEQRRKREAMDLLVAEISKGEEENIANSIRVAIEVLTPPSPSHSNASCSK